MVSIALYSTAVAQPALDRYELALVGHSMGAGEVVRQVSLNLLPPRAAVAVGGGGRAVECDSVKTTPWFIAAGEQDFGRDGATALAKKLQLFGNNAEYRDYRTSSTWS
jgi:fermentation-respiration switch protein FrsA (DUF1100 family)